MKKTWTVIFLVSLLALLPCIGLTEQAEIVETETEQTEEFVSDVPSEGFQYEMKFQYMPSIKPLQGTNLIVIESKTDNSLGMFSTDGEEVIPYGLSAVNALGYGFLSAAINKDDVNSLAIYKIDGTKVSDFIYGSVTVYDARWIAGMILEKATGGEKDVIINKENYRISQCDLYFVSEDSLSLAASLDRSSFKAAKQHGDYISIQNQDDAVVAYDRSFNPVSIELKDIKSAYYRVENYQIISNITNEVIADGYSEVKEADQPNRMLLVATEPKLAGFVMQAVLDTSGNVLMPADYTVIAMDDPYVVVADENGQRGLYSLNENRLIVPCEYSNIYTCTTSNGKYINNGYVSMEKDGMRGYVDIRTGEESCPPAYNSRIAKVYGCSTVFDGEKGFVVIAADGTRTELFDYEDIPSTRGDGYLLVAKKNGYYGVIDWHGNEVLPFIHQSMITLTDDSKALIRTSTGSELDVIISR